MTDKYDILVVDDDAAHRIMLKTLLTSWGYNVIEVEDGDKAVSNVKERPYDLVLMDIRMVNMSGLDALEHIKNYNPAIPVILITAYASIETAVEGIKKGAYDYLQKPLNFDELKIKIERAIEHKKLKEENIDLKKRIKHNQEGPTIIGRSYSMTRLLEMVHQVAPTEATVLITGESGTGKELIAEAIHYWSPRRNGPLVKINCAAITETLLESELFGHEKGAFTGADHRKEGKFRQAEGGTIFLDEISESSLAMQAKLLRAIQDREITRVGGNEVIKVNVRIIAATNKDLVAAIKKGSFREDLFYRLNVVTLYVPPLRDRREDIPLLAEHFLRHFSSKNGKNIRGFTPQAMDKFLKHSWPGNVRELMNTIERAVIFCQRDFIEEGDIYLLSAITEEETLPLTLEKFAGHTSLDELEKEVISATLKKFSGNKSETARRLGITRRTLLLKMKKYGIH
ncbi:MAG: sigma-54 dependent transcriptional regulator [Syntrophales bacterium]|nr:sigma-54 dependent transcriptional regulator [Syntrophales bacterium]